MVHQMKLWKGPFDAIRSGRKRVELRLNDPKRQKIQPGDQIVFTQTESGEQIRAEVLEKLVFPDFQQLYQEISAEEMGYAPGETPDFRDMERFYSREQIQAFGTAAIRIRLL